MKRRLWLYLFDPQRSTLLYLLGTAVVTLIIQFAIDWANEPGVWKGSHTLTLIVVVITVLALVIVWYQRQARRPYLLEEQQPRTRQALVLLVSPHKGSAPAAIEYHKDALRHCWLIATGASAPVATELATDPAFAGGDVSFHYGSRYQVDPDELASTYRVTRRILTEEMQERGIPLTEVIVDITGGTKTMTAGMVMACMNVGRPMQYVKAGKDEKGQAHLDAWGKPIRIDTGFMPTD